MPDQVTIALADVAGSLPGGGESRPGQAEMARAVGRAMEGRRHLVVQAGTGTGKSLAYLVPAALAGEKVVVATATKALQDQLAGKDLPRLAASLDSELTFALLKGRSNYVCVQRVSEVGGSGEQLSLDPAGIDPPDADDTLVGDSAEQAGAGGKLDAGDHANDLGRLGDQVRRLVNWAQDTPTGDRAELPFEPHFRAWAAVSTTARECPGAYRCPSGQDCFAEAARARAASADIVVVNTHLYGAHLASGGAVLPPHDLVIFDEAHEIEEVMTSSLGVEIGPGRFRALAAGARGVVESDRTGADSALDLLGDVGDQLREALRPFVGKRIPKSALPSGSNASDGNPGSGGDPGTSASSAPDTDSGSDRGLSDLLDLATGRLERLIALLRQAERGAGDDEPTADRTRRDRVVLAAGHLAEDLRRLTTIGDDDVPWVDGGQRAPVLRVSPIDVAPLLAERLWESTTAVLTSATVPVGLVERLGLPADQTDQLDVGSPFDYRDNALLYVAKSLPDRRRSESEPALHDELEILINAAGGRTLALFTSWRAMNAALEALRPRLTFDLLAQADLPKPALVEAFRTRESTCLFATLGFWQGVDLPGPTLSLVTIDRIPFPRPDEPVLQARRDRAGARAFAEVDLPRAGTLLAQGAGRLIRSAEDRGVVAVLDSRLATASYRGSLLARVPPMKRTLDRTEVIDFLTTISSGC